MTNTSKLKGRMAEKGFTLTELSETMHLSRPCLRKKINGDVDFKVSEIERLCDALEIKRGEVAGYFFASSVPKMETRL